MAGTMPPGTLPPFLSEYYRSQLPQGEVPGNFDDEVPPARQKAVPINKNPQKVARPTRRLNNTYRNIEGVARGINRAEFVKNIMARLAGAGGTMAGAVAPAAAGAGAFFMPDPTQTGVSESDAIQEQNISNEIANAIGELQPGDFDMGGDSSMGVADVNEPALQAEGPGAANDRRRLAQRMLSQKLKAQQNSLSQFDDILK